jgi:hypothetical protein
MSRSSERRRSSRRQNEGGEQLTIGLHEDGVLLAEIDATLVDYSEWGLRVNTCEPVGIGCLVSIGARDSHQKGLGGKKRSAHVVHCGSTGESSFRLGLVFQEFSGEGAWSGRHRLKKGDPGIDLYEVLQVSPNADFEMIQRVYRLLAQRYHPDNSDSGNEETFKQVLSAYRVLGDPAERAAYDAGYRDQQRRRWKVFDKPKAADGVDAERCKRQGVISLLYTKKMREPRQGGLTLRELEDLLDIPKEHLEFCFWYLGENGLVVRGDSARYEITVKGVNWAEESGTWGPQKQRLLESPEPGPQQAEGEPFKDQPSGLDQWASQAS